MPHVRQHLAQPNWVETALCLAGCIEEMVAPLIVLTLSLYDRKVIKQLGMLKQVHVLGGMAIVSSL